MSRILVWDLPTRLLHWLLVFSFAGAIGIALSVDDDLPLFHVHMLLGLVAALTVLLRLAWGLAGTRYARFGSFLFGPGALLTYLRGVFTRSDPRYVGHNPGAAYGIYAMLLLPLALAGSGLLLTTSDALDDLHPVLAYAMLGVIGTHVAGLAWHWVRHRENLAIGMLTGRKDGDPAAAIPSARPVVALLMLMVVAGWAALLMTGHDATRARVTLPGFTLPLGEPEDDGAPEGDHEGHDDDGDDDD